MKNNYILTIVFFNFLFGFINAQEGYTYTLVDNGSYSYSISAVPNPSVSNFATSVQSYGFTIIIPDGVTITLTSSFGGAASPTFFNGNDVGDPTIDGYLITETLGSPMALPAPSTGTSTAMVTIQVNNSPTSGTISILANDSALASAVTPLKSFMQADMIDDGMAVFTNVIDPNASGLSGMSSYDFDTLSVDENIVIAFSMSPNPASDIVTINIPEGIKDIKIKVYDALGKKINLDLSEEHTIDVSNLSSGLYLISLITDSTTTTKRLIVN